MRYQILYQILQTTLVDLGNLSDVVKNDVGKNTVLSELVTKIHAIRTTEATNSV